MRTLLSLFCFFSLGPAAAAADVLLAECDGRTYRHRIYLVAAGEAPITMDSFRYERRTFFGDSLQEAFPVRLDEADRFENKFTFTSFAHLAIFSVTAGTQVKNRNGRAGRAGSGMNYRQPGAAPPDHVRTCWMDLDRLREMPAWLD